MTLPVTPPPLFRHQQALLDETCYAAGWFVAFEQGCGKTAPTIHNVAKLYVEDRLDGVLVVAPNNVHRNWITDEVPKHCSVAWQGLDWHSARGKGQDKALAKLLEVRASNAAHGTTGNRRIQELAWLAISYDGLLTERGRDAVLKFKQRYPRFMLVIDEGARVKNAEAKRTKKVVALRKFAAWARVLNGTPVTNSPLDVYAQIKILDDKFWLRHGIGSWTSFRSRFAVLKRMPIGGDDDREAEPRAKRGPIVPYGATEEGIEAYEQLDLTGIVDETPTALGAKSTPSTTGRTVEVIVGYRELDKLREMIAPITTRITKEDAGLDLPPKLYSRLMFDMTVEQRRIYDTLRTDYMVELDNGALVTAPFAMVRLMRLQQIACGYLPNPEDEENPKRFFDDDGKNPRLELLLDRLEDTPHQAIIWGRFTPDVDAICRALGPPKCARYDGQVSQKVKEESLERFHAGKAQFLVAKAASMGVGLTLVEAKSVFYYSNTFSYYERMQSEDRAHRIGQLHPVMYYDLVAARSVDGKILQSLRKNEEIANVVTGDRFRGWLEEA
jgi:SNF2 family DNA or RNA helicase